MIVSHSVSVVITTYNRSDALLAVLGGLSCQTDRAFEVIVADDGSRQEHQEPLFQSPLAKALKVTHVWHPDVGFTASRIRNRGVAQSSSPYIVFLDGDCVPEVDFIAQHKALAQTGAFVNGSRVMMSQSLTERVLAGSVSVVGRGWPFWLAQRLRGQAGKLTHLLRLSVDLNRRIQSAFSWKGIRSCNMGVWRTDFERIDGFDESFIGWGHEDADFVLRLQHSGLVRKNGFCSSEVYHLWHPQASRQQESANARLVSERSRTDIVRATLGYSQERRHDDAVITRIG